MKYFVLALSLLALPILNAQTAMSTLAKAKLENQVVPRSDIYHQGLTDLPILSRGLASSNNTTTLSLGYNGNLIAQDLGWSGDSVAFAFAQPSGVNVITVPDTAGVADTLVFATLAQTLVNKTLTAPVLGAATATSVTASGAILSSSSSAGVGYKTGAGSTVSQATNRSTGVTVNAVTGTITGNATSLAAGAEAIFTVTNSAVALNDVPVIAVQSGPTANTSVFSVSTVAAGSFNIRIRNLHASTADTGAPIINFAILKGSAN